MYLLLWLRVLLKTERAVWLPCLLIHWCHVVPVCLSICYWSVLFSQRMVAWSYWLFMLSALHWQLSWRVCSVVFWSKGMILRLWWSSLLIVCRPWNPSSAIHGRKVRNTSKRWEESSWLLLSLSGSWGIIPITMLILPRQNSRKILILVKSVRQWSLCSNRWASTGSWVSVCSPVSVPKNWW